ncbi:MAG: hypothetical protein ABI759_26075 [Candidatus Solibacter sp.]
MARTCLLVLCLSASLCRAQELATTDDGRQVLLSTWWRLPGEGFEPLHFGIYRSAGGSWTATAHTDQGPYLTRPYLSHDGSVAAWERTLPCQGSCMLAIPRSVTEFDGLTAPASAGNYSLTLSRNQRFMLSPGFLGVTDFQLQDLSTGLTWSPPAAPYLRAFGVADNGAVLGLAAAREVGFTTAFVPNRLVVWRPNAEAVEIFRAETLDGWLSADGGHVLVEVRGQSRELWLVDVANGARQRIAQLAADGTSNFLETARHQISNDGSRVAYLWPSQNTELWFWQSGGEGRVLAQADEGFLSMVLSGDGRIVWAFTASGRLLKIAVDAGTIEEVLGALPPRLGPGYAGSAPGSAMVLASPRGGGISTGLRFTSGTLIYPVIDDASRDSIAVQIPWEAPTGPNPPLLVKRDSNAFELPLAVSLDPVVRPVIAGTTDDKGNYQIKAALQDFSALVSPEHPAPAGSTIHTWFYNLGPLDRPVPTGIPGPSDPASVPLAPLGCFLLPGPAMPGRPLPMPFLAYAPGMIGVYQADLTIPADFPAGPAILACDSNGVPTSAWLAVGPASQFESAYR